MADAAPDAHVRDAYDQLSQLYVDNVGSEMQHVSVDRASLALFAELVGTGAKAVDVGCGPGHIAAFLASKGLNMSGIDISPAMIELASAAFPDIAFRVGCLADLPVDDSSVDALVSRHSVIHTEPQRLADAFSEFARVLQPNGLLFVSFFATNNADEHGRLFDHQVCTAYQLDPSVISDLLASYGFSEEVRLVRQPGLQERQIPHATLFARSRGDSHLGTGSGRSVAR